MTSIHFDHGLGDCTNFAHQIPLYTRRGQEIAIACPADKAPLFMAAGATIVESATVHHDWPHSPLHESPTLCDYWRANKAGWNLNWPPLAERVPSAELWREYLDVALNLDAFVPRETERVPRRGQPARW